MAAVFAFGKRGANNRAPVSNYLISKGFDFDGVKVGLGREKGCIGMANSVRPVALVTGASAGIGAALAREAANDGHDLVLVARRREPMEALAAELKSTGAEITVIPTDLGKPGAAAALMKTIEERGLVIDTLINNAGFGDTGRFDLEDPKRILAMLQVNVVALTELTRLVLPQMVARKRGKVMLLASTASFLPGPGMAVYYATKSYVLSFGRAIGYELRGTGVTVTTLCPGPTTSEFAQVANMQGVALLEGPMPVMTAAEVARQGYAALKAERPQVITGLVNGIIAMSTRFTPTSILLMITGHLNSRGNAGGDNH
jgi:short-subunit dehydrogenase